MIIWDYEKGILLLYYKALQQQFVSHRHTRDTTLEIFISFFGFVSSTKVVVVVQCDLDCKKRIKRDVSFH